MSTILENLTKLPDDITKSENKTFALMALVKEKDGKTNKLPINVHSGHQLAWKKHPEQLATFKECFQALQQNSDKLDKLRLGVLLHPQWEGNDELIVVDIDHRPDLVEQAKQGTITSTDRQADVVKYGFKHDFYIEISQSGEGLHLIQLGHKHNPDLIRNDSFEYYDTNRWICLTGNCIHTTPDNMLGVNDNIFEELEEIMFTPEERSRQKPKPPAVANSNPFKPQDITDLLKKAMNAKNGEKFKELYSGASPSGDTSSDDMSFLSMLAFWTQKNPTEMDTIFRGSGRMRPKWDEIHTADGQTYGQMTIASAIANTSEVYTPKKELPKVDKTVIKSNADIINTLSRRRTAWNEIHTTKSGAVEAITDLAVIQIMLEVITFKIIYTDDMQSDRALYFYDYDNGIYSRDVYMMERFLLAVAPEKTATKTRNNIIDTIFKMPTSSIKTVKNDVYKSNLLAVGNGILNLNTKELLPFSPDFNFTTKIATNYNQNASQEPVYGNWSWSHSLKVLSDGDFDKLKLLWQVCRAAILGVWWLRQAVLLVDDGHGQTGKSTFEDALIGVVGKSNTAQLRFIEMNDENKLIDAIDKRFIIGDDNDVNSVINRYDYLNPLISSEIIRVKQLYKDTQTTTVHAFILQSCNGLPPFKNATEAFFNRLKIIYFAHHHDSGNANDWRVKNDYIRRQDFREWLLWYVVNKVNLGIHLTDTEESKNLITEAKSETDTIQNFVTRWLPNLKSTVIPVSWLYSFYATACSIDNIYSGTLPQKRFAREILNNFSFSSQFKKKRVRVGDRFKKEDADMLLKLSSSVRWGKGVQSFFPITRQTIKHNEEISTSSNIITEGDFDDKISSYSGYSFVRIDNK